MLFTLIIVAFMALIAGFNLHAAINEGGFQNWGIFILGVLGVVIVIADIYMVYGKT